MSPVLFVTNLSPVFRDFHYLNDKLIKINKSFPLIKDCMQAIGQGDREIMSVIFMKDSYVSHTVRYLKI